MGNNRSQKIEPLAARQDGQNYIASTGPDVCKTPMGSSMVPVAYSSIAFLDGLKGKASTVRVNGNPQFNMNTHATSSTGTEPGTGKGVKKGNNCGPAHVTTHSSSVRTEGFFAARDGDPASINEV